jgi:hypothetical protein
MYHRQTVGQDAAGSKGHALLNTGKLRIIPPSTAVGTAKNAAAKDRWDHQRGPSRLDAGDIKIWVHGCLWVLGAFSLLGGSHDWLEGFANFWLEFAL